MIKGGVRSLERLLECGSDVDDGGRWLMMAMVGGVGREVDVCVHNRLGSGVSRR